MVRRRAIIELPDRREGALTTATFDKLKTAPSVGRAGSLRQAMLDYLNDPADPKNAYPAFWAPFVVIGEGAAK